MCFNWTNDPDCFIQAALHHVAFPPRACVMSVAEELIMALSVVVSLGLCGFYNAPRPLGNSGLKDAGHQLPNNVYIQLKHLSLSLAVHFQILTSGTNQSK